MIIYLDIVFIEKDTHSIDAIGVISGDYEYDSGEEVGKSRRRGIHETAYENVCTEKAGHVFKSGSKGEDYDRRHHCDEALGDTSKSVFEGNEFSAYQI